MRYWPEISFRYSQSEVNRKDKAKVNIFPRTTDTGSAINYARCTRVLRKLDSCPGEKLMNNMSAMQNSSTTARTCSTREPSWAEDFIDLSEFCRPSTIPTRMEDCADECSASASSIVRTHGFDNGLDGNDGLDQSLEETLWYMPSPNTIREELCDPITDWLAATKETMNDCPSNNDDLLPSSHTEISYNLNDLFLSPRLTSVPNAASLYDRKSMTFSPDDSQTPPLQSDTTFFHSSSDAAIATASLDRHHQRCSGSAIALNSSLLSESLKAHTIVQLPPADLLFKENPSPSPPQPPPPPLPSISALPSASTTSPTPASTSLSTPKQPSSLCNSNSLFQLEAQPQPSRNQFLDCKTEMSTLDGSQVTINANASFPRVMPSPSITQSTANNSSHINEPSHHLPSSSACTPTIRGVTRSKLEMASCQPSTHTSTSSCTISAPEMLNPLVNKNTEFDLVSYVFEDNKASVSFDLSNLSSNTQNDEQTVAKMSSTAAVTSNQAVTIKTEPKDDSLLGTNDSGVTKSSYPHLMKRKLKDEDDDDDISVNSSVSDSVKFKRSRRLSNCSSEDLTQLESEKYRELRNKNNEASRRSRANRKNREVEMREHAFKLEAENRRLKFKAEEMEKLVKRLRNCLMQLVLKRS